MTDAAPTPPAVRPSLPRLPNRRLAITHAIEIEGQPCLFSIGFDRQGFAREIFVNGGKPGGQFEALLQGLCVALSLLLRDHNDAGYLRAKIGLPGSIADQLLEYAAQIEATSRGGIIDAYRFAEQRGRE